jgi:hypothetical protein
MLLNRSGQVLGVFHTKNIVKLDGHETGIGLRKQAVDARLKIGIAAKCICFGSALLTQ